MTSRRLKVLYLSPWALVKLLSLSGQNLVRIEGMPPDARIVNVSDQVRFCTNQIAFMVESETFPAVEDGQAVSELDLQVSAAGFNRETGEWSGLLR